MENLQTMGISHGNISLENILVHNDKCVLIDFGQCRRVPFSDDHQRLLMAPQAKCGKRSYMAPEIANDEPYDGFAVDLWSVGIILFALLTGEFPWGFAHESDLKFARRHPDLVHVLTEEFRHLTLSTHVKDLLHKMLQKNPQDRMSLRQVLNHAWLQMG